MSVAQRIAPATTPAALVACAAILGNRVAETRWMPKPNSRAADRGFVGRLRATADFFVAQAQAPGGIAGSVAVEGQAVPALYVAGPAQWQGVGAALLGRARQGRARLGLRTFQADLGARRFYRRHGFRELRMSGGQDNKERLPDVCLASPRSDMT